MNRTTDHLELLLVEDNPADVYLIRDMLQSGGLRTNRIHEAERIQEACELLRDRRVHIALLDLSLPDSHGIDSFLSLKKCLRQTPIIILTGLKDAAIAIEAIH